MRTIIYKGLSADNDVARNLDQCGGHADKQLDYHYHAGEPGSNAILACLSGEFGCVSKDLGSECDASAQSARGSGGRRGSRGPRPDFSEAAKKLGVSEEELMKALGPPPPNFDEAAKLLGITPAELQEAMGSKAGQNNKR